MRLSGSVDPFRLVLEKPALFALFIFCMVFVAKQGESAHTLSLSQLSYRKQQKLHKRKLSWIFDELQKSSLLFDFAVKENHIAK